MPISCDHQQPIGWLVHMTPLWMHCTSNKCHSDSGALVEPSTVLTPYSWDLRVQYAISCGELLPDCLIARCQGPGGKPTLPPVFWRPCACKSFLKDTHTVPYIPCGRIPLPSFFKQVHTFRACAVHVMPFAIDVEILWASCLGRLTFSLVALCDIGCCISTLIIHNSFKSFFENILI